MIDVRCATCGEGTCRVDPDVFAGTYYCSDQCFVASLADQVIDQFRGALDELAER